MVAPTANVLNRLLTPAAECLDRALTERIADLRLDSVVQARLDELARKSLAGTITERERAEYVDSVEAIGLIGVLPAKARQQSSRPREE